MRRLSHRFCECIREKLNDVVTIKIHELTAVNRLLQTIKKINIYIKSNWNFKNVFRRIISVFLDLTALTSVGLL